MQLDLSELVIDRFGVRTRARTIPVDKGKKGTRNDKSASTVQTRQTVQALLTLPVAAALTASSGWAFAIVIAQSPARNLGAFEFTRIQLVACSAIMAIVCSALGYWPTIAWEYWPAFIASIVFGMVLGNLAMIECLRLGGPRRTEVLLALKAPLVAIVAFFWLGERPAAGDLAGSAIVLLGVMIAVFFGSNAKSDSDRPRGALVGVVVLGVAAAGFQGFGFLVMKPAMQAGTEPIAASTVRLLGAALLISLVALWPSKRFRGTAELSPQMLGRTILPGFIGYGISSSLLLYAFANFDAGIATVLGSLSPIFVLPVLWFKEGVPPRPYAVLGAFLAIAGTGLIVLL